MRTLMFFISSKTPSSQRVLGLLIGLLDMGFHLKHTLGIYNALCFSTATMVARMRLNITLYVHCLSY